jgi:hypothetical protein
VTHNERATRKSTKQKIALVNTLFCFFQKMMGRKIATVEKSISGTADRSEQILKPVCKLGDCVSHVGGRGSCHSDAPPILSFNSPSTNNKSQKHIQVTKNSAATELGSRFYRKPQPRKTWEGKNRERTMGENEFPNQNEIEQCVAITFHFKI